jgi:tetratricopeptide (TPR) repeat protein
MIRRLLFLILTFLANAVAGQRFLPDSLQQKFKDLPQDSNYINRLNLEASEYLRTNPNITRSIVAYALEVAPKIKYTKGYARALTVMGNAYWYEGIYEFAQNYYLLAARQYETVNDSIGLAKTYNNIGEVYKKLDEYDKSLSFLVKASALLKRDTPSYSLTLYNIGELYIRMNNIPEAKKYTEKSLAFARAGKNQRVIAFNYWSLGALERMEKNYEGSLQYYIDSEKLWKDLGEIRSMIQTYQDIAEIYREQGKYDEAEQFLKKAMLLATRIKVADLQVNNYFRFSQIDSLRGNYKRALYYLSRHNSLKDSVYNLLKAEQIARLQTIYETESREQENRQLRSEKALGDSQLKAQKLTLSAISLGLILAGVLAWFLYQQRKKISVQKEAIEMQAVALLKLNEELQELNKNLEGRIEQRTSQLTAQNQLLTEYTFINAHKLRAPVASILGLINLLQQVTPAEREAILVHLKTCGEQLDTIIREVSRNLEGAIVREPHTPLG